MSLVKRTIQDLNDVLKKKTKGYIFTVVFPNMTESMMVIITFALVRK